MSRKMTRPRTAAFDAARTVTRLAALHEWLRCGSLNEADVVSPLTLDLWASDYARWSRTEDDRGKGWNEDMRRAWLLLETLLAPPTPARLVVAERRKIAAEIRRMEREARARARDTGARARLERTVAKTRVREA
jgi:hypothetical protein